MLEFPGSSPETNTRTPHWVNDCVWGKEGQKDQIKERWVICHSQYDELKILPLHWMHYRCVWACAYMRESEKPEEEKSAVLGWMDGSINVIEIALQHITGCINTKENISIHHAFTLPLFDQSLSKTWPYFYTFVPNFWKQRLLSIRARNPYLLKWTVAIDAEMTGTGGK